MTDHDWQWLEELPEEWSIPDDLWKPTRVPAVNLVIRILASEMLGNDVIDLVCQWLSAYTIFNGWIGIDGKRSLSLKELFLRGTRATNEIGRLYKTWTRFATAFESSGRHVGTADSEHSELVAALRRGISELHTMTG